MCFDMNEKIKKILFSLLFLILLASAFSANAVIEFGNPSSITSIQDLVSSITNWILGIAAGLVILFLIIGGIYYISSAGDDKQIEEAKKIIKYAVIGLIIILISYSLVLALNNIIFGNGSSGPISITSPSVSPNSGPPGTAFTIRATITAAAGVNPATVIAHIQKPDEADISTLTLSAIGGGVYSATWNSTGFIDGPYFVDINACDINANCTEANNI